MPQRLGGQLLDGGDPVADEPVFVVDTGPVDEGNWSIVATDRSAADGSWSVTVPNADAERYHAVAEFEESGTLKNALSKPFLTSQPFAQPNAVSVGFDVLSPAVSVGSAIPDSEDLQHHWITDDGSGSVLSDDAGTQDGDIQNAVWVTSQGGSGGTTLEYDGSSAEVVIPTLDYKIEDGQPHTFFAWVYPEGGDRRSIFANNNDSSPDNKRWYLELVDDNTLRFWDNIDDGRPFTSGSNAVPNGEWSLVTIAADSQEITAYANDGVELFSTTDSALGVNEDFPDPFKIGERGDGDGRYFDGYIDRIAIYDRVFDQSEVIEFYDATVGDYDDSGN